MRFFYGTSSSPKVGSSELTPAGAHAHSTPDSGIRFSLDLADRESGEKVSYPADQAGLADQEDESRGPALAMASSKTGRDANQDYAITLSGAALACGQATDFMSEKEATQGWDFALGLAKRMSGKTRELRPMFPTGAGGGY